MFESAFWYIYNTDAFMKVGGEFLFTWELAYGRKL